MSKAAKAKAKGPEMKPVESAGIASIGYDREEQTLHVHFRSGAQYKFQDVSPEKHEAFMAAKSFGKHFQAHIRHGYTFERLDAQK